MTFGPRSDDLKQCSEEESHQILDRFVEWGGNFIDTADVYQLGLSETIVGNWLKNQDRKRFVIATKCRANMGDKEDVNNIGLSRKHIMDSIDGSLRRLQTDYIDIYQIHAWDDGVPIEETLSALNDLVQAGKVRYVGASNVLGWQLQKIVDVCQARGYTKWISLQQQYSLLCRESEFEVFTVCKNEGIGILPWSPLKGGLLSGKYRRGQTELGADTRLGFAARTGNTSQASPDFNKYKDNEKFWKLIDVMEECAKAHGRSVAQVALRWLLQRDNVPSIIIGAKTLKQLDDNMGAAAGWELSSEQMAALNEASMYDVPYPYEMVWRLNETRHH
jgi:aryl-alcohol dehydrogenase-like predicted oxidoreductase